MSNPPPEGRSELAPRVLHASRGKWSRVFSISALFTAAGIWMLAKGEVLGWAPLIFFGLCALVAALELLRPGRLELTRTTMTTAQLGRRKVFDLRKCGEFGTWSPPLGRRASVVVFDAGSDHVRRRPARTRRPESSATWRRLSEFGGANNSALPDTYGLRAGELADLLNRYRAAALSDPRLPE